MAIHDDIVDLQAFQISDLACQVERLLDIYEQIYEQACFFRGQVSDLRSTPLATWDLFILFG